MVVRMMETDDRHNPVEVIVGKGNRFPAALVESKGRSPFPPHDELLAVRLQDGDLATAFGESFGRCPRTPSYVE